MPDFLLKLSCSNSKVVLSLKLAKKTQASKKDPVREIN